MSIIFISGVRRCADNLCGHLWRVSLLGGCRPHLLRRQGPANSSGNGDNSRTNGSGRGDRQVGEGRALGVGHQAQGLGGGDGSIGRSLEIAMRHTIPPTPFIKFKYFSIVFSIYQSHFLLHLFNLQFFIFP